MPPHPTQPPPPPADVPVLGYGNAGGAERDRGRRWAVAAFLWSFFSPVTVAGAMRLLVEGVIDIDDLLPRNVALAVIGVVGMGIPFAGVLAGGAAWERGATRGQRWLSAAAVALGLGWCVAALVLFVVVVNA